MVALDKAQPDAGQEALTLLHSPQPPPFETILTVLINTLTAGAQQILLILDVSSQ